MKQVSESGSSNTSTRLFHWILPHPIMAASGPLTSDSARIQALLRAGASAVVTKTITPRADRPGGGCFRSDRFIFNRQGYSSRDLAVWEDDLRLMRGQRVIANIYADSADELATLAQHVVATGVEVIELGLSCPTLGGDPVCFDLAKLSELCVATRRAVDVPLLAKLLIQTSSAANRQMALCLKRCGIDGVSLSDTLPGVVLDAEDGTMMFGGVGGLSSPAFKPLVLKALHDISDIGLVTVGIGGIESSHDVLDYLRMGCSAVQVCSHLIRNGRGSISVMLAAFEESITKLGTSAEDL